MGKLYEVIKSDYEIIKKFKELEKTNFFESRKFNNYDRAIMAQSRINRFLKKVEVKSKEVYKNENKNYEDVFKDFENLIGENNKSFPILNFAEDKFYDCQPILDKIEADLPDWAFGDFLDDEQYAEDKYIAKENNILTAKTNAIRAEFASLNITKEEFSIEDRTSLFGLFDRINKVIITKNDDSIMDKPIDEISKAIAIEAKNHIEEYAEKNGFNAELINETNQGDKLLDLFPQTKEQGNLLRDISNNKLELTQEYKNKILGLDRLVNEKQLQLAHGGESAHKEYGFTDWFNKATEVKNAVLKYSTIKFDQRAEKIACLKEIYSVAKEFAEIDDKYDDIMNYIRENFDIDKISLPGNVYSGRVHPFEDIKTCEPDLPRKYDYQDAPYGVILNGYAQIKAFCNENNITLENFLEDPNKEYKKAGVDFVKRLDQKYLLPRENNSLGKRMAHILIQADKDYTSNIYKFINSSRSLEFLWQTQDQNEKTFDNFINGNSATNSINMLNHGPDRLFIDEEDEPDYSALKSLFSVGENVDNLFTLSNNYRDENFNLLQNLDTNYVESLLEKENENPALECDRVLKTINDFLVERKYISDHEEEIANGGAVTIDTITPAMILTAGREYFKDYVLKNKINILDIPDKTTRNKVLEFINDPTKAFQKKYGNNPNLFINNQENFNALNNQVKVELEGKYFFDKDLDNKFQDNNQKQNGYNTGKNITRILSDNKGGFFERYILRSTSKEYKALENAVKAANNPESSTHGDYDQAKIYAIKYLEHKLPEGTNEANLSSTSKKRIEFCRSLLKTLDALPPKFEEQQLINDEVENKQPQNIDNDKQKNVIISNDMDKFQKDLNEDLNKSDNIISNDNLQNDNNNEEVEISNKQ